MGGLVLGVLCACSSTHRLPFASFSLEPITEADLVSKVLTTGNVNDYTQISRFSVAYSGRREENNFKGYVRIAQDSLLMLSLSPLVGGEVLRTLFSEDSCKTLNRLDHIYTASAYDLDDQMIPLPFDMLQAVFSYNYSAVLNADYKLSVADGMYLLEDQKQRDFYTSVKVDAAYRVRYFLYKNFTDNTLVNVEYTTFFEVDGKLFPENVEVRIQQNNEIVILRLEFKKVEFKPSLAFPFHVSSHYVRQQE